MKVKESLLILASIPAILLIVLTGGYAYLPLHILITLLVVTNSAMYRNINIFTPLTFTSIYIALVFFLGYFFYHARAFVAEEYLSVGIIDQSQLIIANYIALLSVVAWLVGYKFKSMPPVFVKRRSYFDKLEFSPATISVLYVAFFIIYCTSVGGIPLFIDNYHGEARTELGKGLGVIYSFIFGCQTLYLIWLARVLINSKGFQKNMFMLFYLFLPICVLILLNERGALVAFLISVFIVYNQTKSIVSIRHLVVLFLALVVVAGSLGAIRSGTGVNGFVASAAVNVLLEAGVEYDNYNEVVRAVPNELPYQHGSTVLATFTILVPRALLPNKDEIFKPAGVLFKEFMNHEHIRVGERITLPGELLLNFGVIGLVFVMSFYGFIGHSLHTFFARRIASPFYQGLYPIILISYSGLIVGDISSISVGLISSLLIGYVLFVFVIGFHKVIRLSLTSIKA